MDDISWGKPLIEYGATGVADAAPAVFLVMPTCEENSAILSTNTGAIKEAFGEGHERVGAKAQKSSYTFVCKIFFTKGLAEPMTPEDGVVATHQVVRLTPEDVTQEGWIMRKCLVQVATDWSSEKGKMLTYTFSSLQPSTGKQLEDYTKTV